jgi:hypothetical protein
VTTLYFNGFFFCSSFMGLHVWASGYGQGEPVYDRVVHVDKRDVYGCVAVADTDCIVF